MQLPYEQFCLFSAQKCPKTEELNNTVKMSADTCRKKCQNLKYGGQAVVPTSKEDFDCLKHHFGKQNGRPVWSGVTTAVRSSILVDNFTGRTVGNFGGGLASWPLSITNKIMRCVYFQTLYYTLSVCDRQPELYQNRTGIIHCVCYTGRPPLTDMMNCEEKTFLTLDCI